MGYMDSFIEYREDGTSYINCKKNDERFTHALGCVFNECVNRWNITYAELSKIILKYKLIDFIYESYLILCHQGTKAMVDEIEEYINQGRCKK